MNVRATIDYELADNGVGGELEITNWDDQLKLCGGALAYPIYVDRAELIRAVLSLDVASEP